MADTFGEHFKDQALIDVDPATFETLELPHEASTGPLSFHDDLEQLANKCHGEITGRRGDGSDPGIFYKTIQDLTSSIYVLSMYRDVY